MDDITLLNGVVLGFILVGKVFGNTSRVMIVTIVSRKSRWVEKRDFQWNVCVNLHFCIFV